MQYEAAKGGVVREEHLIRQSDLIPTSILGTPITILGAGAIGGFVTLALAKMGFGDIEVWDGDEVDTVNLASQFFRMEDIGRPKTAALHDLVLSMTGTSISPQGRMWAPKDGIRPGILITAVDSMAVRQLAWKEVTEGKSRGVRLLIDPRMGAEEISLHTARPGIPKDAAYGDSLYTDAAAVAERCTAKATAYTVLLVSGLVARTVKGFLTEDEDMFLRTTLWSVQHNQVLSWNAAGKKVT